MYWWNPFNILVIYFGYLPHKLPIVIGTHALIILVNAYTYCGTYDNSMQRQIQFEATDSCYGDYMVQAIAGKEVERENNSKIGIYGNSVWSVADAPRMITTVIYTMFNASDYTSWNNIHTINLKRIVLNYYNLMPFEIV